MTRGPGVSVRACEWCWVARGKGEMGRFWGLVAQLECSLFFFLYFPFSFSILICKFQILNSHFVVHLYSDYMFHLIMPKYEEFVYL
jgi:hypothetical protein